MSDVLSQKEIDELLSALSSGEMDVEALKKTEGKKIKTYDFKRALRFSKDQIRSLLRVFENYARLLTTHFSARLRTFVQISVESVEQLPYEEFIRSVPQITILNVFHASPLEGRMVMEVNPNIAYAMLDRLLGGIGATPSRIGDLTEIEANVMERIFRGAIERLPEAFKSIVDLEPTFEFMETNPQFLQIVSPNETVAVVSLQTKVGEVTGIINFCLPHVVLEPIIPKLTTQHWFSTQKKAREQWEVELLQKKVKQTPLPVVVDLGYSQLSVEEFLKLEVGDVIRLNETVDDALIVKVGPKPKFKAQPGIFRGKRAVRILEEIREEDGNGQ
ncbi:flagellar motor switch protein FliM [Caldalkalibacillus thermarum TA2.A1]|uniref:Flagellar motor switch protein FliM n=1 Tax=Caldalkalibacillus thermarum (strain TA2.A1) TaxID=986075 RepID=F5L807_CALTT|nr:flagellar motor switch protein FliM [Caldalkalibacillus thermarum]EGL82515.1 flagellar motor switch protein FliM [Caldalkalibacillus thermarum TA2.A1]QZT33013.1 flagellar motor switch protein FliM [Caldalkalibacillus thermarum TA2.A1]